MRLLSKVQKKWYFLLKYSEMNFHLFIKVYIQSLNPLAVLILSGM